MHCGYDISLQPPLKAVFVDFDYNPYHYGGNPLKADDLKLLSLIECLSAIAFIALTASLIHYFNPNVTLWIISSTTSVAFSIKAYIELRRHYHAKSWLKAHSQSRCTL